MTITAVFNVTPKPGGEEAAQAYSGAAGPMLTEAGGTNGRRVKVTDVLIGDPGYAMTMMMDFPSREALERVFASDAYKALIPGREKAFSRFDCAVAASF